MITWIYDYIFKKKCIKCMILIYEIACYYMINLKSFHVRLSIFFFFALDVAQGELLDGAIKHGPSIFSFSNVRVKTTSNLSGVKTWVMIPWQGTCGNTTSIDPHLKGSMAMIKTAFSLFKRDLIIYGRGNFVFKKWHIAWIQKFQSLKCLI